MLYDPCIAHIIHTLDRRMISIDVVVWILTFCDIPLILDMIRKASRMCLFPEIQSWRFEATMLNNMVSFYL